MIEFIKQNITWLKELATIVLAVVATVLAILTYRRAKATLFQPIRSEVIKTQSALLSEILLFINKNQLKYEGNIDYRNLVKINTYINLKEFGFILKNQESIDEETKKFIISQLLLVPKTKKIKDVEIIGIYKTKKPQDEIKKPSLDKGKNRNENAKKGFVEIERVSITKNHEIFFAKLSDYAENPFLPNKIKGIIKQIQEDINTNRTYKLIEVLEAFIVDFTQKSLDTGPIEINPDGVYNQFNHKRIHHKVKFDELYKAISDHLRIEEKF
jgi:hypothetical protein